MIDQLKDIIDNLNVQGKSTAIRLSTSQQRLTASSVILSQLVSKITLDELPNLAPLTSILDIQDFSSMLDLFKDGSAQIDPQAPTTIVFSSDDYGIGSYELASPGLTAQQTTPTNLSSTVTWDCAFVLDAEFFNKFRKISSSFKQDKRFWISATNGLLELQFGEVLYKKLLLSTTISSGVLPNRSYPISILNAILGMCIDKPTNIRISNQGIIEVSTTSSFGTYFHYIIGGA